MAPTTVHLVRHAAHGLLPHTLAGRMPGVALSDEGRAQAAALPARLGPVGAVLSSPVQRALETAAALGRPVAEAPGFEEIDFGRWTGLRFDALDADPAWHAWNAFRSLAACPGGETMHAAQSRALSALQGLRGGEATVAVVSHADIIKAVLAAVLGVSLDRLDRFTVDPASISTVVLFDGYARVERINS